MPFDRFNLICLKMQEIDYFNGKKILVQTQLTKNEEININSFIIQRLIKKVNCSEIQADLT